MDTLTSPRQFELLQDRVRALAETVGGLENEVSSLRVALKRSLDAQHALEVEIASLKDRTPFVTPRAINRNPLLLLAPTPATPTHQSAPEPILRTPEVDRRGEMRKCTPVFGATREDTMRPGRADLPSGRSRREFGYFIGFGGSTWLSRSSKKADKADSQLRVDVPSADLMRRLNLPMSMRGSFVVVSMLQPTRASLRNMQERLAELYTIPCKLHWLAFEDQVDKALLLYPHGGKRTSTRFSHCDLWSALVSDLIGELGSGPWPQRPKKRA
eukprot:Polyplicarium_translucidae@DN917_c0_g1_i1.p1